MYVASLVFALLVFCLSLHGKVLELEKKTVVSFLCLKTSPLKEKRDSTVEVAKERKQ